MSDKILDEFKRYQDQFGFNSPFTDGTSGKTTQNGSLFTVEYALCILSCLDIPLHEKAQEIDRIRSSLALLEKYPGVFARVPNGNEHDSMDNGCALVVFSALFGDGDTARRIYQHGLSTRAEGVEDNEHDKKWYRLAYILNWFKPPRFFWNAANPKLFCFFGWHGRSPGYLALLKAASGHNLSFFEALSLLVGQFAGCFKGVEDMDARKLPYIAWQFLKEKGSFWKFMYAIWLNILRYQYPNGMQDVYASFYGKDHPIVKYVAKFGET